MTKTKSHFWKVFRIELLVLFEIQKIFESGSFKDLHDCLICTPDGQ